jgi:hypothetical protein
MEKDALLEIEKKLDTAHNNGDHEAIEALNKEHKTILDQVCERGAVKLRNFKIQYDEKPSKGMIELEKKLTGYTNVSMLYGPVETHAAPDTGGLIGEPEKNPRRKILINPKEVRQFMTTCKSSINTRRTSPLRKKMYLPFLAPTMTKMCSMPCKVKCSHSSKGWLWRAI